MRYRNQEIIIIIIIIIVIINLCQIMLCGLLDLRPAVLSQRLVIYSLRSTVWTLVVCSLQMSDTGYSMCGPNGFSAVLVINRVSTLATVVLNRVWVLYSSLELGNVV